MISPTDIFGIMLGILALVGAVELGTLIERGNFECPPCLRKHKDEL